MTSTFDGPVHCISCNITFSNQACLDEHLPCSNSAFDLSKVKTEQEEDEDMTVPESVESADWDAELASSEVADEERIVDVKTEPPDFTNDVGEESGSQDINREKRIANWRRGIRGRTTRGRRGRGRNCVVNVGDLPPPRNIARGRRGRRRNYVANVGDLPPPRNIAPKAAPASVNFPRLSVSTENIFAKRLSMLPNNLHSVPNSIPLLPKPMPVALNSMTPVPSSVACVVSGMTSLSNTMPLLSSSMQTVEPSLKIDRVYYTNPSLSKNKPSTGSKTSGIISVPVSAVVKDHNVVSTEMVFSNTFPLNSLARPASLTNVACQNIMGGVPVNPLLVGNPIIRAPQSSSLVLGAPRPLLSPIQNSTLPTMQSGKLISGLQPVQQSLQNFQPINMAQSANTMLNIQPNMSNSSVPLLQNVSNSITSVSGSVLGSSLAPATPAPTKIPVLIGNQIVLMDLAVPPAHTGLSSMPAASLITSLASALSSMPAASMITSITSAQTSLSSSTAPSMKTSLVSHVQTLQQGRTSISVTSTGQAPISSRSSNKPTTPSVSSSSVSHQSVSAKASPAQQGTGTTVVATSNVTSPVQVGATKVNTDTKQHPASTTVDAQKSWLAVVEKVTGALQARSKTSRTLRRKKAAVSLLPPASTNKRKSDVELKTEVSVKTEKVDSDDSGAKLSSNENKNTDSKSTGSKTASETTNLSKAEIKVRDILKSAPKLAPKEISTPFPVITSSLQQPIIISGVNTGNFQSAAKSLLSPSGGSLQYMLSPSSSGPILAQQPIILPPPPPLQQAGNFLQTPAPFFNNFINLGNTPGMIPRNPINIPTSSFAVDLKSGQNVLIQNITNNQPIVIGNPVGQQIPMPQTQQASSHAAAPCVSQSSVNSNAISTMSNLINFNQDAPNFRKIAVKSEEPPESDKKDSSHLSKQSQVGLGASDICWKFHDTSLKFPGNKQRRKPRKYGKSVLRKTRESKKGNPRRKVKKRANLSKLTLPSYGKDSERSQKEYFDTATGLLVKDHYDPTRGLLKINTVSIEKPTEEEPCTKKPKTNDDNQNKIYFGVLLDKQCDDQPYQRSQVQIGHPSLKELGKCNNDDNEVTSNMCAAAVATATSTPITATTTATSVTLSSSSLLSQDFTMSAGPSVMGSPMPVVSPTVLKHGTIVQALMSAPVAPRFDTMNTGGFGILPSNAVGTPAIVYDSVNLGTSDIRTGASKDDIVVVDLNNLEKKEIKKVSKERPGPSGKRTKRTKFLSEKRKEEMKCEKNVTNNPGGMARLSFVGDLSLLKDALRKSIVLVEFLKVDPHVMEETANYYRKQKVEDEIAALKAKLYGPQRGTVSQMLKERRASQSQWVPLEVVGDLTVQGKVVEDEDDSNDSDHGKRRSSRIRSKPRMDYSDLERLPFKDLDEDEEVGTSDSDFELTEENFEIVHDRDDDTETFTDLGEAERLNEEIIDKHNKLGDQDASTSAEVFKSQAQPNKSQNVSVIPQDASVNLSEPLESKTEDTEERNAKDTCNKSPVRNAEPGDVLSSDNETDNYSVYYYSSESESDMFESDMGTGDAADKKKVMWKRQLEVTMFLLNHSGKFFSVDDKDEHYCKICNKYKTNGIYSLTNHLKKHLRGALKCTKCSYEACTSEKLAEHLERQHGKP